MNSKLKVLLEHININELEEGKQYRFDCFNCNDTKQHLYIKREGYKVLAYCFKCGFKLNAWHYDTFKSDLKRSYNAGNTNIYTEDKLANKLILCDNIPLYLQDYLQAKGFNTMAIKRYGLRYDAYTKRLAIPCYSLPSGLVTGYVLKLLDSKPKVLNAGNVAYGWNLRPVDAGYIVLVEDGLSSFRLAELGLPAVSLNGLYVKANLLNAINNLQDKIKVIVLYLDDDSAGLQASLKIKKMFDNRYSEKYKVVIFREVEAKNLSSTVQWGVSEKLKVKATEALKQ